MGRQGAGAAGRWGGRALGRQGAGAARRWGGKALGRQGPGAPREPEAPLVRSGMVRLRGISFAWR
jgi:hypothetical protein